MDILNIGKAISDVMGTVIDKIVPDAAERERLKNETRKLDILEITEPVKIQLEAILAEARSQDKWTSRARPSFMYVMYVMIGFAIPMGILSVFRPDMAVQVAAGMKAWLAAIPDSLYALFGVGYLGYTGARSWDKLRGTSK